MKKLSSIQRWVLIACCLLAPLTACVLEQKDTMTHHAKLLVSPAEYPALLKKFDTEMAKFGLVRTGADSGLNLLKEREVLFGVYHTKPTDNWWFLSVHDIQKVGDIDIKVYAATLKDEADRKLAVERVDAVLAQYGARLEVRTPQNK